MSEQIKDGGPAIREVFRQLVGDLHFHRHEALASSPQPAQNAAALRDLAQALAWQCFGECRGYSERLLSPREALEAARDVLGIPAAHAAPQAQPSDTAGHALASLVAYLREEADFNRSWTDGRRSDLVPGEEYAKRRLELAQRADDWADAVERLSRYGAAPQAAIPEIEAMLRLCEDREWTDTNPKTALGQRLESVLMGLHNDLHEARDNAAPQAGEDARPTGTLVGLGGGWIINPDAAQAAPLAAPTRPHQTTAHPIKEPYTLAEIEARIASHDYSAELLLLHAMELLRGRPGEDARPVAWEVTNDSFSFWTAVRKESRARDIADEQQRAGWPGAEVRPLVYATPQPSAQAAPAVPLTDLHKFYGVESDAALIAAQQRHIEKLQARMPSTPSLAPQRPREG